MMKIQMGNLNKENVLRVVQFKGPVIPNDVRKELGGENLIIGAILSELAGEGKVKVSSTKIGGTPAYYTPGTEARLQNLMKYLNEKDRQTAELLKQRKVLKDSDLTPLLRVSLRNIRDFAKPLQVTVKGQTDIYWKWYLIPTLEAEQLILRKVKPIRLIETRPSEPVVKKEEKIEEEKPAEIKPELVKEKEKPKGKKEKEIKPFVEVQKELGKPVEELEKEKDPFFKKIWEYFRPNDIQIIDYKVIRKKSEIELMIAVPSRIGSQEYYCKAKSKAKVNDGDLSSAYIQGQAKKLPVIFITTGEMTKKAKDMLSRDFKGMIVKKI